MTVTATDLDVTVYTVVVLYCKMFHVSAANINILIKYESRNNLFKSVIVLPWTSQLSESLSKLQQSWMSHGYIYDELGVS